MPDDETVFLSWENRASVGLLSIVALTWQKEEYTIISTEKQRSYKQHPRICYVLRAVLFYPTAELLFLSHRLTASTSTPGSGEVAITKFGECGLSR